MIIYILAFVLIFGGVFFFLGASIGILRFPDFYSRMHAAGKGDTLSTLMIITGIALIFLKDHLYVDGHMEWVKVLVAIKIMAIGFFIAMTSPTSTHALIKAGFEDGIKPVIADDDDEEGENERDGEAEKTA